MKKLSKLAFVAFACVLVISAVAVMSPRSVHAVIATLVKDVDTPARHPFTTNCDTGISGTSSASCSTPPIPAGEEVVIETVGIGGSADPTNTKLVVTLTTTAGGASSNYWVVLEDTGIFQTYTSSFNASPQLRLYADPGTPIHMEVRTKGLNPSRGLNAVVDISGYWVSLP